MNEIKRFNHHVCDYDGVTFSVMGNSEEGKYVSYSDHEAEIARLRADLEGYMMGAAAEAREVDARGEEIKRLRAEIEENENVINVWRGRTQRAETEVEAYRKDAERYRWLRDLAPEEWSVWRRIEWPKEKSGSELRIDDCNMDSEIDAAMGASA